MSRCENFQFDIVFYVKRQGREWQQNGARCLVGAQALPLMTNGHQKQTTHLAWHCQQDMQHF